MREAVKALNALQEERRQREAVERRLKEELVAMERLLVRHRDVLDELSEMRSQNLALRDAVHTISALVLRGTLAQNTVSCDTERRA